MTSRTAALGRLLKESRTQDRASLVPVVREIARPVRRGLVLVAILSVIVGLAESGVLILLAQMAVALSNGTDTVKINLGPLSTIELGTSAILLIAAVLVTVRFAATMINTVLSGRMAAATALTIRSRLLDGYFGAAWELKAEDRDGHLQELTSSMSAQAAGTVNSLSRLLGALFTFVTLGITAFAINPWIAGTLVVVMTTLLVVLRPLSRLSRSFSRRYTDANLRFVNAVTEAAGAAQDIEVYGVDERVNNRLIGLAKTVQHHQYRRQVMSNLVPTTYQSIALMLILVGLGVVAAIGGDRFGALSAIVLLFVRGAAYGQQVQSFYQNLHDSAPFVERLDEAVDRYRANAAIRGGQPLEGIGQLDFDHVSFSYSPPKLALDDVTFSLGRGETIGVVGPSGAGKSTLVQLMLRLRMADSGAVRVNGEPSGTYAFDDWTRRVAYVPQQARLLAASVSENIAFFRRRIDEASVVEAAKRAHLHDEIAAMSDGYATWVGDDGRKLSGGQRQRVTIARALAGRPDLLILDEPTSALDMRSESLIQRTFEDLRGSVTMVIIAHRLSTLTGCDRIMVLGDGKLQAFDTPERVLENNAFYRQAVELSRLPE